MKPTFLILGAAKCGTTSLYHYLRQHPDICMSEPKEPFFFEAEYEKGMEYYWKRYFAHWRGEPAVGEARHRNLYLPFVARRIRESLPEAKLIVLVRNPIDRAYSHWWHWFSRGQFKLGFEEAIAEDLKQIEKGVVFEGEEGAQFYREELIRPYGYHQTRSTIVDSGYYACQLERYRNLFPDSQIKTIFLEDLAADPERETKEVFRFLGVDENKVERVGKIYGQSALGKGRWSGAGRLPGVKFVPERVKRPLRAWLAQNKGRIGRETRRMLAEHYCAHNRRLEQITGRDLSHWNQ